MQLTGMKIGSQKPSNARGRASVKVSCVAVTPTPSRSPASTGQVCCTLVCGDMKCYYDWMNSAKQDAMKLAANIREFPPS